MIRPMTDEEAKRAIERAKANRFDEAGNYGENNGPLPKMTSKKEKLLAAWDAYKEVEVPAMDAYKEVLAPAWAAYQEVIAPAWSAYQKLKLPAWAAYQEARAKIEEEHKDD